MKSHASWKRVAISVLLAGATIGVGLALAGEETTQCFGHSIPPFQEVFVKLFRATATLMSMDQLKTTSAQMSDTERAAISYYLGEKGHRQVKEGLPQEKQVFLDEKYRVSTGIPPVQDFQAVYPHILAISNNNLGPDQLRKTLESLAPADLASQSFYLGEEGRKILFSEMTLSGVEEVLNRTEDWTLIETGKRTHNRIKDYTCILYKQERLGKKLQDVEKILLKYREKPKSMYMKWLDGPWTGRELVYNEALLGAGRVRVREKGTLGLIAVTIPVDWEIAKRGSNHPCTEIGMKYLLFMIENDYRKGIARGELVRKNYGMVEVDGRQVFKIESILPKDSSKGYYCYRMMHYIDFMRSLEIKAEIYRWDDQLYESYLYTQIKLNTGLTDRDFDPKNPDYRLD